VKRALLLSLTVHVLLVAAIIGAYMFLPDRLGLGVAFMAPPPPPTLLEQPGLIGPTQIPADIPRLIEDVADTDAMVPQTTPGGTLGNIPGGILTHGPAANKEPHTRKQ
jgi:hypothetical protein